MKKMTIILTAALFLGVMPLLAIAASQGTEMMHGGAMMQGSGMMHDSTTMPFGHMQSGIQDGEHMGYGNQGMHGNVTNGNCAAEHGANINDHHQAMHATTDQMDMKTNHHDMMTGNNELAEDMTINNVTALNTPCPGWQSTTQTK